MTSDEVRWAAALEGLPSDRRARVLELYEDLAAGYGTAPPVPSIYQESDHVWLLWGGPRRRLEVLVFLGRVPAYGWSYVDDEDLGSESSWDRDRVSARVVGHLRSVAADLEGR